ncbi:MAG TPA: bifunctional 3-deoxy-7-phosphoheptulonate synthase/chorismate mutase type II [Longimicrobium sp.]|nr:bifunctional 3-deoxy-7-phosphoheptulonate synthase/chorismate mutase type II [Longimicrobium sp.]
MTTDAGTHVKQSVEMDDERRSNGHWLHGGTTPVVIAGPCSAESEAQMHEAARRLSAGPARYLRAGVWKPRTRPNNFEGIGTPALAWLRDAGHAHGIKTATEVAHAWHVEAALEHGIDLVWIGARTTASPFSVQELANALRGTPVAVLVKNPTSPDVDLWEGAVERLAAAGVTRLGIVHRGFSMGDRRVYRNLPMWELAIELRRRVPELPMICDPSHIAGRRDLIEHVSQRAMDLGMDGLMIEAHPTPDQAWSDAEQQITPDRAIQIVTSLRVPRPATDDPVANLSLRHLRDTIDTIDAELLDVLESRMRVVERIGEWKRAHNVNALQLERWNALLHDRVRQGAERGLPDGYVQAVYEVIHSEALRRQSQILDGAETPEQATIA